MTVTIYDIEISDEAKKSFALEAADYYNRYAHAKGAQRREEMWKKYRACMDMCEFLGTSRLAHKLIDDLDLETPLYEFPVKPIVPRWVDQYAE